MRFARSIASLILSIGILSGLGYGAYLALIELARLYADADSDFKLGILAALISLLGVVWSVIYQRRKELMALQFERKREAYGAFFDMFFDFVTAGEQGIDPLTDPKVKAKWTELTKNLMIWGNARTINAFNKFQASPHTASSDIKTTSAAIEQLMREFRADLGHRDRNLKPFALTKLIVRGDEHYKFDA